MENEKTLLMKVRENPYMVSTFVLGLVVLVLIINSFVVENKSKNETDLCFVIRGTPAWIVEGEILDYGYKGNISVEDLINDQVEFYYRNGCGYCELQINSFDNWTKYQESGLTKEC